MDKLSGLLRQIQSCEYCINDLPNSPRPLLQASASARLLIIGQAPGRAAHEQQKGWADPSGDRLREWLGVTEKQFYNPKLIAFVPMGFCYPGRGKSGDLPPRPECAQAWHQKLLALMPEIELTILLSQYAQKYYLGRSCSATLTATVKAWQTFIPDYLPLPHPSPRNNIWLKRNEWFLEEVIPYLQDRVASILEPSPCD